MTGMYVVISGNPFDGMEIYGPFWDTEQTTEWAEHHAKGDDWWAMKVTPIQKEPTDWTEWYAGTQTIQGTTITAWRISHE